ncbi:unannotated protein [freshwater metagenome]|uniref:Unannotated protein n=1 Tax=freshwater metagenome TaxID=449393 RepID=A0A6J7RH48_9ZZZZ
MKASIGEARRAGSGMLLSNTNVVDPSRVGRRESIKARRAKHCSGDRHHIGAFVADPHNFVTEYAGPGGTSGGQRFSSVGVEDPNPMEAINFVTLGWAVAAALLGDRMHYHRPIKNFCPRKGVLHLAMIMPVNWADVLKAEIFKHSLRRDNVLDAFLHPMQCAKY